MGLCRVHSTQADVSDDGHEPADEGTDYGETLGPPIIVTIRGIRSPSARS
jgi:hypothetical protein